METNTEKSADLKIWRVAPMGHKTTASIMSSSPFDQDYLTRLRRGDEETAKHFNAYFRRMLRIKLWSKFGRAVQTDLMDEIMAAAMEKILAGEPRDPSCLAAYIRGICTNLARHPDPNSHPTSAAFNLDHLSDRALSAEEQLISKETARTVRMVLTSLKPRDRHILTDLFYNDLDRREVCRKYNVNREQLRLILFRARGRFQKKWLPN
jgi:RNA polymerase sigma factor (sigma-70 family)